MDGDACRGRAPPRWHGCRLRLCCRSGGNLAGGCGSRRTQSWNIRKFCVSDSTGALPSFVTALAVMDNVDADQRLNARAVDQALELERQAGILQGRASFRVALLQVEHALGILCNELGAKASPSLRLQCERGGLLLGLGRYHEALADARAVTKSYTTLLGPLHPNTLAGRHLQARVLGRSWPGRRGVANHRRRRLEAGR